MRTDTFHRINGEKKNIVVVSAVLITAAMLLSVSLAWFAESLKSRNNSLSAGYAQIDATVNGSFYSNFGGQTAELGTDNTIVLENRDSRPVRFRLNFANREGVIGSAGVTVTEEADVSSSNIGEINGNEDTLLHYGITGELAPGASTTFHLEYLAAGTGGAIGMQVFSTTGNLHYAKDSDEFRALLTGSILQNGDTVALQSDITIDEELSSSRAFNLALCGHALVINANLNITATDGYFGTMDFASSESMRNEHNRKGSIGGTGTVSIVAPNVAVRCGTMETAVTLSAEGAAGGASLQYSFDWGERNVRLLNGLPDSGLSTTPAAAVFMLRSVPLSRNYSDVQMSHAFVGEGTRQNPYRIASLGDFKKLQNDINTCAVPDGYEGVYFRLITDLDFTRFAEIDPIGGNTLLPDEGGLTAFRGHFDGMGHQLIGLKINAGRNSNVGVFGAIDGATVENLIKSGGYVSATGTNVAGLVGRASNGSSIHGCYQTSPVCGNRVDDTVGGIVGLCEGSSSVTNCYNAGTVNKPFDTRKIAAEELEAMMAREREAAVELSETGSTTDSSADERETEDESPVSMEAVGGERHLDGSDESDSDAVSSDAATTSSPESGEGSAEETSSLPNEPETPETSTPSVSSEPEKTEEPEGDNPAVSEPADDPAAPGKDAPDESPVPDVINPFEDFDFSVYETLESEGKYVGGIAGYCDADSVVKYSYSLADACDRAIGETANESQDFENAAVRTLAEFQSPLMADALNIASPGCFKPGNSDYPYPWLNMQRRSTASVILEGKTVRVSATATDFNEIEPEDFTETGDISDPYLIDTAGKYKKLVQSVAEGETYVTSHFRMAANFDFDGVENVLPIGGNGLPFCGEFDGGGHVIYNLTLAGRVEIGVGVFGYLDGAYVYNLGVEGGSFTGSMDVGGIAGAALDSTIQACYNTNDITILNGQNAGGILGRNEGSRVTGCYNAGSITAPVACGGVIGYNNEAGVAAYCYSLDTACADPVGMDFSDSTLTTDDLVTTGSSIRISMTTTSPAVEPESPEDEGIPLALTMQMLTKEQMTSQKFAALLNLHSGNGFLYAPGRYPRLLLR